MPKIYSKEEIKILRTGGRKLALVVSKLIKFIKPGVNGEQVDQLAKKLIIDSGGRPSFLNYQGFPSSICISVNNEVVHSIPTSQKFKEGDIVGIDVGMYYNGYHTDMAVTVAVGKLSPEKLRFLKTAKKSLDRAIRQCRPGKTVGDIGYAINHFVESQGYSVVRELSGHGVGRKLHEEPTIPNYGLPGKGKKLRPGMVLAIEPIINMGKREVETDTDGWCVQTKDKSLSAHFEHTIVITQKGSHILTKV